VSPAITKGGAGAPGGRDHRGALLLAMSDVLVRLLVLEERVALLATVPPTGPTSRGRGVVAAPLKTHG